MLGAGARRYRGAATRITGSRWSWRGDALAIEYQDGGPSERVALAPGQVDWDEPTARIHRGVNIGAEPYEEITVFFLDRVDAVPQPQPDEEGRPAGR